MRVEQIWKMFQPDEEIEISDNDKLIAFEVPTVDPQSLVDGNVFGCTCRVRRRGSPPCRLLPATVSWISCGGCLACVRTDSYGIHKKSRVERSKVVLQVQHGVSTASYLMYKADMPFLVEVSGGVAPSSPPSAVDAADAMAASPAAAGTEETKAHDDDADKVLCNTPVTCPRSHVSACVAMVVGSVSVSHDGHVIGRLPLTLWFLWGGAPACCYPCAGGACYRYRCWRWRWCRQHQQRRLCRRRHSRSRITRRRYHYEP